MDDAELEDDADPKSESSREGRGINVVDRATALKEMPNAVADWVTQNTGGSERVQYMYNTKDGTLVVNHADNPPGDMAVYTLAEMGILW